MSGNSRHLGVQSTLLLTAFAAGTVDIIGFAELGGVFPSAMTGNFALLAYHLARGESHSALGSVIALSGFVTGCVLGFSLRRGREQKSALTLLLAGETALLLLFAAYVTRVAPSMHGPSGRLLIAVLAIAMGLQAVVGQTISLTTIVFTTTLTRLVGTIVDSIAASRPAALQDVGMPAAVLLSYLCGAVLAATLTVGKVNGVALLPVLAVSIALAAYRWGQRTSRLARGPFRPGRRWIWPRS